MLDTAAHVVLAPTAVDTDGRLFSPISSWLIDSGASNHMTPVLSDLIADVTPCTQLVQVANGVIIPAPKKGTARIRLFDINGLAPVDVLLANVLYTPGLNRRLLSVPQWNEAGGSIHFNAHYTELTLIDDSTTDTTITVRVNAPFTSFSQEHVQSAHDAVATTPATVTPATTTQAPVSPVKTKRKMAIPSGLLHRRLGHRSVAALGAGSEADVWDDATMTFENDPFCWGCKVVLARQANRGSSPLASDAPLKAGDLLMVDVIPNPSR